MTQTTITEALADLKTVEKRMNEKQAFVVQYVARPEILLDPLAKDGGAEKCVAEALQAFYDLATRHERIRCAIMSSNLATSVTLQGETKTVFGWLTWRREIEKRLSAMNNAITSQISGLRNHMKTQQGASREQVAVTVTVSEVELQKRKERIQTILGELDGQLSLLNATTKIDV